MEKPILTSKEMEERGHRVFKGYTVKLTKNQTQEIDDQYVVPWALAHEECRKESR